METRNAMSVLNQPEKITNNNLHEHLAPFGYRPVHRTPELCHHESWPILFATVVENFGVQFTIQGNAENLQACFIKKKYIVK